MRGDVAHFRHRQRAVCLIQSRHLCVSCGKARHRFPYDLLVVWVMPFVDRAIQPPGNHSVDCFDRNSRRTSYTSLLSGLLFRFRREKDLAPGAVIAALFRASPSFGIRQAQQSFPPSFEYS